jgi:hypothetical protein
MHMRHAAGVASPREGAMSEGDLRLAAVEQNRPELSNLFAMRNRVSRNEADACR